jgi:hypothetical protein
MPSRKNPMEWRPRRPHSAEEILGKLKEFAPSVAFQVGRTADRDFRWDGDGPDPRDEGYVPYDVEVSATAIVEGEVFRESANLGGSYMKPEEFDLDVHGYLPQMLLEAAVKLFKQQVEGWSPQIERELEAAVHYLKKVMRERYDREQRRGNIDRGGG